MQVSIIQPNSDSSAAAIVPENARLVRDGRAAPHARTLRERHWTMLSLAMFVIFMSFVLQLRGSNAVAVPWLRVELPSLCGSRALFGVECPGCGLTRSFLALAAGDVRSSFEFHRLGWLLALAVVAQIPYRTFALREMRTRIVRRAWPVWFGNILIAALLVNWLLKFCGY